MYGTCRMSIYTTDKHNLIIGISLLQWHCYLYPDFLCLNIQQVTIDYPTLEAHISRTKINRNKWISDSESRHIEGYRWLRGRSICTSNIHAQRDVQKHVFYLAPYYLKLGAWTRFWQNGGTIYIIGEQWGRRYVPCPACSPLNRAIGWKVCAPSGLFPL